MYPYMVSEKLNEFYDKVFPIQANKRFDATSIVCEFFEIELDKSFSSPYSKNFNSNLKCSRQQS